MILLEQNYRSTQTVLDVARSVIDLNRNRTPKELHTDKGKGDRVMLYEAYNEREEAEYVLEQIHQMRMDGGYDFHDFAVMYRTNAQSRAMEQAFINNSIPYVLVGGVGFYKRREVKDMLSYLRVVQNPDDRVSFERIVNVPKRAIGKKSIQNFQDWQVVKISLIPKPSTNYLIMSQHHYPTPSRKNSVCLPNRSTSGKTSQIKVTCFTYLIRSPHKLATISIWTTSASHLKKQPTIRQCT